MPSPERSMRGFVFRSWKRFPELTDVPIPTPGPGEVLLRVAGSGACHSDVHLYTAYDEAADRGYRPPFILGHEVSGWAEAWGPGVEGVEPSAAYLVYAPVGCGACAECWAGEDMRCRSRTPGAARAIGFGRDGGMAEFVVVPASHLVPLGDADPIPATALADAGLTPLHAIKGSASRLDSAERTALVIGVGGLGQLAVQLLRTLTPARILATDVRADSLSEAERNGAEVLLVGDHAIDAVLQIAPDGVDAVFDFVGSDATLALAAGVVAPRGRVTVVGIAGGTMPWTFFGMPLEVEWTGSFWGTLAELDELALLYRAGRITPRVELFSLDQVATAYRLLEQGRLEGRAVIVPSR